MPNPNDPAERERYIQELDQWNQRYLSGAYGQGRPLGAERTARDRLGRGGDYSLPGQDEWNQLRDLELGRLAEEGERIFRQANAGSNVLGHEGSGYGDYYRNQLRRRGYYDEGQGQAFQSSFEMEYAAGIARENGVPPGEPTVRFANWLLSKMRRGETVTRASVSEMARREAGDFSIPGGGPELTPYQKWQMAADEQRRTRGGRMQSFNQWQSTQAPGTRPATYQGTTAQYGQAVQVQPITQPQRPANPYQNPAQATQPGRTPPTEREQPSYGGTSYADPMQLSSAMGTLGYNAAKRTPLDEAMERFR